MPRIHPASWLATSSVAVMLLAGCAGGADAPADESPAAASQPAAPPPPQPAPAESAPPADATPAPAESAPPAPVREGGQVQSAPRLADAAEVSSWAVARPQAKLGVAVDLKYQIDGEVAANRPVTLRVALVPRVAGTNLSLEVRPTDGMRIDAAPLALQKANAAGVYRHSFAITPSAGKTGPIRVLVGMDTVEGRSYGIFTIPVDATDGNIPSNKQESVKQR
jgi:hypothetical protein